MRHPFPSLKMSRRHLLTGSAALATAALLPSLPRPALAAPVDRKFLFFFASGGWDATQVFDPHFGSEGVDMDEDTTLGTAGNLQFTAGEDRPEVGRFFSRWGSTCAIVNGIDAHSVGHDSAAQFMMTGTSASSFSDWPTLLAAHGQQEYALPHLVFSGPSFPGSLGATVVRAGGGTLLDLMEGSILGYADQPSPRFSSPAEQMLDAYVHGRTGKFASTLFSGLGRSRADALHGNLGRAMELKGRAFEAGLSDLGSSLLEQATGATEMMRLGLCRCAMLEIPGGWDSHGDIDEQPPQFDDLFGTLDALMDHLATTPGAASSSLLGETVIVLMSEFGRTPKLNGSGGKDHWPYGSALVMGAGVKGNQQVGLTDDELIALPIDLSTGASLSSGSMLGAENFGTALLALGGLDPQEFLPDVQVLEALLR